MKINLSAGERTLIRKIALIQIDNIVQLMEAPSLNSQIRKMQYNIDEEYWEEAFMDEIETFEELKRDPGYIFDLLEPRDIETVKQIMELYLRAPLFREARNQFNLKLELYSFMNENPN